MNPQHILVVEDEDDILELIRYNLERDGYAVTGVESGERALRAYAKTRPDLILLDLMLPGIGGIEICRNIRGEIGDSSTPIVMVTARGEETDIVAGLEAGADDYVTKPFSPKVLLARIRAVLRRKSTQLPGDDDVIRRHEIVIHPGRHEVFVRGEAVPLTNSEFKILHFLARRPGWVFTRYQIVDGVKGEDYAVTDRAIDVAIVGLRKKLGECAGCVETVRGVGYRFKDE